MFDHTLEHALAAEESGFSSVWVMDHFWQLPALGGPDEPILEAYTLLGALAARTERVQPRHARHRRHVPQSRAAREDGDDARRDLARPRHPRYRRGLVRRRARGLRLRLPRRGRTARPAGGGGADLPRAAARRTTDVPRPLLPDGRRAQRPETGAARRSADHDRRQRREAHVAPRRAVRRHVQRERGRGDGPPQARRAACPLRRRRPRSGGDHDDPARHARTHRTAPRRPNGYAASSPVSRATSSTSSSRWARPTTSPARSRH